MMNQQHIFSNYLTRYNYPFYLEFLLFALNNAKIETDTTARAGSFQLPWRMSSQQRPAIHLTLKTPYHTEFSIQVFMLINWNFRNRIHAVSTKLPQVIDLQDRLTHSMTKSRRKFEAKLVNIVNIQVLSRSQCEAWRRCKICPMFTK